MSVFWIVTPSLNNSGRNITHVFSVDGCETVEDLRSALIKEGAICGTRFDLRWNGQGTRTIVGRKPLMLTLHGIWSASLFDWTLSDEERPTTGERVEIRA